MSKNIKCIGYMQTFQIKKYKWFKKYLEDGWVIRGLHYFYIDDENIEAAYLQRFKINPSIINGWGDWYQESDNVDVYMSESSFTNVQSKVIELTDYIMPTMKELYEDMDAEQFKEWFSTNN